ncbi:MAG: helix-turn-helix transcriptional regulator [Eggerthellaceae bacterium]|nr:helix-turn-helix transcriptional regulator [Eggerthellaceae bacterium]
MIAERIKSYIQEKGYKQVAIADGIGMKKVAMSETLNGNRNMTAEEYVRICDFLEVPYSRFSAGAYPIQTEATEHSEEQQQNGGDAA